MSNLATPSANKRVGFVGIGAQKCATTWIYDILRDHPQVGLSVNKEVNFFSQFYDHGYQWYERQFGEAPGATIFGEFSPSYFNDPAVPARVARYSPEIRLILSLRDPVERAISNHRHEVRVGHFQGDDLSLEAGLANNPSYVDQGLYATHLRRWLESFPLDRCLILLFDDIQTDPDGVARRVYSFLGVDPEHRSEALNAPSNVAHVKRSTALHDVRRGLRETAQRLGLGALWEQSARWGLRRLYRRLNWMPAEAVVPPVSSESRRFLRDCFRGEVDEIQALTGLSVGSWLRANDRADRDASIQSAPPETESASVRH